MLFLLALGCATALEDTTPYVSDARVLAVRLDPAEAEPGTDVVLTTLYADATGELADAPVDWDFCVTPRPLAELGPVAQTCLVAGSADLTPLPAAVPVTGTLPTDACSVFGPNPPPSADGITAGRPADPDVTGGFYQPIVGFVDDTPDTLVSARVRCGLANVTQETYAAWNGSYHDNANPRVTLTADATVAAGGSLTLTAAWDTCPDVGVCGDNVCSADEDSVSCAADCADPVGCGGAETYTVYDPDTQTLSTRREALSATWFATDGTFAEARNGRAGDELDTAVTNDWVAPDAPGDVWVWAVLRDERGGVDFAGVKVTVE